jgi:hypothetical protein
VAAQAHGSGKRALVIGGRGKMGGGSPNFWPRRAFASRLPIRRAACRVSTIRGDWENDALDFDLIVLATPLERNRRPADGVGEAQRRAD